MRHILNHILHKRLWEGRIKLTKGIYTQEIHFNLVVSFNDSISERSTILRRHLHQFNPIVFNRNCTILSSVIVFHKKLNFLC